MLALLVRGRALAPVVDLCSLDALAVRSLDKEHTQAPTLHSDKLQGLASRRSPWSDVVLSRKICTGGFSLCSTYSFHVTSRRPEAAIDWARSAIARCPASFGNSRALISLFAPGRRQVFVAAAAGPIRASAIPILLGLGRDRRRRRILYLPTISAPGAVRGSSRFDGKPSQLSAQVRL